MNKLIIFLCLVSFALSVNMDAAVNHLVQYAEPKSLNICALYVANALEAGGFRFVRQPYAYLYRTNKILTGMGYKEISKPSSFKKGDITVTDRNSYHAYGHIAMWSGSKWISDFVQNSEYVYLAHQPPVYYYTYDTDGGCNGKSVTAIAYEVINGNWGNGETRKNRLTAAGCNYEKVQAEVNRILYG